MSFNKAKLIVPGMLLLGILELPYGYYTLLRIVTCIAAGYIAYNAYEIDKIQWTWIFGIIAVLFNPIIPIYLDKELWVVIDFVAAVIFLISIPIIKNDADT